MKRTATVLFVHWDEEEANERSAPIRRAGFTVRLHWAAADFPRFRGESMPDAFVISLDRLPSLGRAVAEHVWLMESRHGIPIVFAGGTSIEGRATRLLFPGAIYCASGEEARALASLFREDLLLR